VNNEIPGCDGVPRIFVSSFGNLYLYYQTKLGMCRAVTNDGVHWLAETRAVLLPGVRDCAIIYLQNGGYRFICDDHTGKLDVFTSYFTKDGLHFKYEGICGPVDPIIAGWCDVPHATWLGGTKWRLYFVDGPSATKVGLLDLRTALSNDEGRTWKYEGTVSCRPLPIMYAAPGLQYGLADPTVLYLSGGGYRLYYMYALKRICAADSYDGRLFSRSTTVFQSKTDVNVYDPELVVWNGKVLLYHGLPNGIASLVSV
jgi:hypothetical protein